MKRFVVFCTWALSRTMWPECEKKKWSIKLSCCCMKNTGCIFCHHISLLITHFNEWNTPKTKKISGALPDDKHPMWPRFEPGISEFRAATGTNRTSGPVSDMMRIKNAKVGGERLISATSGALEVLMLKWRHYRSYQPCISKRPIPAALQLKTFNFGHHFNVV